MPKSEKPKRNKAERSDFYKTLEHVKDVLFYAIIDAHKLLPGYKSTNADCSRDLATILCRFEHEGFSFVAKIMPILFDGLVTYLETGVSSYPGFKLAKGCEYPAFLRRHFARIYNDPHSPDAATSISIIYQLSVLFKKFKGPHRKSVLKRQYDDFCDVDNNLPDEIQDDQTIRHAQNLVYKLFHDFDVNDHRILPRPGPGATNTPVEKHERFTPRVMYTCIDDIFPYQEFFYVTPWDVNRCTPQFLSLYNKRELAPTSRFKFVEKQYDKARGICIEENEMQFMQQGLKNYMYTVLENHPLTKGKINFSDQTVNQRMALLSSKDCLHATLDEKEASDRISRALVWKIWEKVPDMRDALFALSTKNIKAPAEGNKSLWNIKKYAPMGSALCFPVMSVVHFALLYGILMQNGYKKHDRDLGIYVYGDDLIVPLDVVEAVLTCFPRYGLKFNTNKSFWRSNFRESCGVHAYQGEDITPIYLKHIPNHHSRTEALLSVLAAEQGLFNKGFVYTAAKIRELCRKYFGMLPMVSEDSPVVGYRRRAGSTVSCYVCGKTRWNRELQRREFRLRVVHPVQPGLPPMGEYSCYFRKIVTKAHYSRSVKDSCTDLSIRYKWVSESQI